VPLKPITSQTSYMVGAVAGNRMVRFPASRRGFLRWLRHFRRADMAPSQLACREPEGKVPARARL